MLSLALHGDALAVWLTITLKGLPQLVGQATRDTVCGSKYGSGVSDTAEKSYPMVPDDMLETLAIVKFLNRKTGN